MIGNVLRNESARAIPVTHIAHVTTNIILLFHFSEEEAMHVVESNKDTACIIRNAVLIHELISFQITTTITSTASKFSIEI